jgi:hypothetical protein
MNEQPPKSPAVTARLVILLVAAGGLALAFAFSSAKPPAAAGPEEVDDGSTVTKAIILYDLPGEDPAEPAEFDIRLEVDTSTIKSRLVIYIDETHGFYVETLDVRFWWKGDDPDLPRDDSVISFVYHINNYIKANETFKDCIEVSAPEIETLGGDIGGPENWGVTLEKYYRARAENPAKFPPLSATGRYCS